MNKIVLIILTIVVFSFGATAQNVNIRDANFKAYLVGNSLINTNMDSEIQVSEANAFSGAIQCYGDNISDLTKGIYFLQIQIDNTLVSKKIIKE